MIPSPADRPIRNARRVVGATRREAFLGAFCLCCLPRAGFSAEAYALDEIAPAVFLRRGRDEEATADNRDAIANIGFVVGRDAVLVTESGGSLADGAWLRAEIKRRTDKPIRYVVMTHVHPDHVFGAAAFAQDEPTFIGHANLSGALEARGDYYRERLAAILGPEQAGRVVYPTLRVSEAAEVDLGDRRLSLTAHATAHTNCDLSMLDHGSGLLFTGDLLSVGRIPSLDGSLLGWLKQIEVLKGRKAARAVPGHGPTLVETEPAFAALAGYLGALRDETRAAVKNDVPIERAVSTVAQSQRTAWHLFDAYNPRNVTQAYKELEWE